MRDLPTPEAMAKRLTPAQRKALLWLPQDGQPRIGWPAGYSTQAVLLRLRLVARWRTCRSVEDHARYPEPYWRPDEPTCSWDGFSLTVGKHKFGAGVFRHVPGAAVRAVLAQEARRDE
jgi:hypothetical protein